MPGHLCENGIEIGFDFDASRASARRIVLRATGERGQEVLSRLEQERNARSGD
jgi:hypothetical protein